MGRIVLTVSISVFFYGKLTPAIDFFYEFIIESGSLPGRKLRPEGLKRHDHIKMTVKKLPLRQVHPGYLLMLLCGPFYVRRAFGITAALISADGLFEINGFRAVFQNTPEKMLIIGPDFVLGPVKSFREAEPGIQDCLVAGNIPVAD